MHGLKEYHTKLKLFMDSRQKHLTQRTYISVSSYTISCKYKIKLDGKREIIHNLIYNFQKFQDSFLSLVHWVGVSQIAASTNFLYMAQNGDGR